MDNLFSALLASGLAGGGGGGGGGVTDYSGLTGKPKIDNHTLNTGNNSSSDLGLQPTISDLATIRSGAALGATAVQPESGKGLSSNDYTTADKTKLAGIEAQANKTVVDSALSGSSTNPVQNKVIKSALDGKQASLTTAQLAAANSGITADIVSADTAALVELVDEGAKNLFDVNNIWGQGTSNADYSVSNSTISVSSTDAYGRLSCRLDLTAGTYVFSCNISDVVIAGGSSKIRIATNSDGSGVLYDATYTENGNITFEFVVADNQPIFVMFYVNLSSSSYSNSAKFSNIVVCSKTKWEASPTYTPYIPSNSELTKPTTELVENGAKNLLNNTAATQTVNGVTFTVNSDGTVTANGTATANASIAIYANDPDIVGKELIVSGCPIGGNSTKYRCFLQKSSGNTYATVATMTGSGIEFTLDTAQYRYLITVYNGYTANNLTFKPMICSKAAYDISHEYVPYALPNPQLTAATIEMVDSGAKNLLKITATTKTVDGVTFTVNQDGTITANGTATANSTFILASSSSSTLPVGGLILSGCFGGSQTTYDLRFYQNSTKTNYDGGIPITVTSDSWNCAILVRSGQTVNNVVFKPMLCTKADWDISQNYQPYVPSNKELAESKITSDIPVVDGSILDYADSIAVGHYQVARQGSASGTGKPITGRRYIYNIYTYSAATATIVAYEGEVSPVMYINLKISGVWHGWYKFEGTAMT